ncbi:MAG: hypothetical protein FWD53_05420 [Phycisphaerales bacterium]|nr:hypothetical protein [Phycisphaerales bacterium]
MLQLDLTLGQKLQVIFVICMFSLAGFLAFRGTRPVPNTSVTSWTQQRLVGIDPRKPVGPGNPADPVRSAVLTVFACHDGQLEIAEFPNDPDTRPIITFRPDLRRDSYDTYRTSVERIKSIKDPYKRTLATAAYWFADGRIGFGNGLIVRSGLTSEQARAEKELQQELLDKIDRIRQSAKTGNYLPERYDAVLRALAEYRLRDGDPTKDSVKTALAHKVLALAAELLNQQQKDEAKLIDKYIAGVDTLLTADQKAKLVEAPKLASARPKRKS